MRRIVCMVLAGLLGVGVTALWAQETKTHSETTTKKEGKKTKTETVTGTVKEYEAGKKIKVTGPKNKTYEFDLDENAKVEGTIAVGGKVKVQYKKSSDGTKQVTVISESMMKKASKSKA